MSDPTNSRIGLPLDYQSKASMPYSRIFRSASIALFFLGGITLLAGIGLSGFGLAMQAALGGETTGPPFGLAAMSATDWCFLVGILLIPAAIGATEIICGIKIRRGSIPATMTGLILISSLVILQIIYAGLLLANPPSNFTMGFFLCAIVILFLALELLLIFLLIQGLKSSRRT